MLKNVLVAVCLSLGLISLVGCGTKSTTQATKSERTEFVGHLEAVTDKAVTDKAVTLRNPTNGHMKVFSVTDKTVIEVDGAKVDKLPAPVKDNSKNCRVHIVAGTNDATKIEFRTK